MDGVEDRVWAQCFNSLQYNSFLISEGYIEILNT
jgi:hypothetical protein